MDPKAWELLLESIKDIKKDTNTIVQKQEGYEKRFNSGNLKFQDHGNRIVILEKDKDDRAFKDKGIRSWVVKFLTAIGLVGIAATIKNHWQ